MRIWSVATPNTNLTITSNISFTGINMAITNVNVSDDSTQIASNQFVQNAITEHITTTNSIVLASIAQSTQTWSFMQTRYLTPNYYTFALYSAHFMFGSTNSNPTTETLTGTYATGNIFTNSNRQ